MNKSDITQRLNKLHNFKVYTFNSKHKMPSGAVGFPDHVLLNQNGTIIFIEVKLGKDELSEKQIELQNICIDIMLKNNKFFYILLTDVNCDEIIGNLEKIR